MKEQFHIVLITVGLFAAGLLMGVWTQRTRPIPPPPAAVLGEFGGFPPPGFGPQPHGPGPVFFQRFAPGHFGAMAAMNQNVAQLEPKIREFQSGIDTIEKQFREKLNNLLSADQQKQLAAIEAQMGPPDLGSKGALPPPPPPGPPLSPPPGMMAGQPLPPGPGGPPMMMGFRPPFPPGGWLMMSAIIYQPALDHLTNELKLDAKQQGSVRDLMIERRTELLALIDKNPPPTLALGETLP